MAHFPSKKRMKIQLREELNVDDPGEEEETPRRERLQDILEEVLGSENVYFQSPSSFQMKYPCIVYQLSDMKPKFADNIPYSLDTQYQITIIDRNPDSTIPYSIASLPKCIFDRQFVSDNLNHYVFVIYF